MFVGKAEMEKKEKIKPFVERRSKSKHLLDASSSVQDVLRPSSFLWQSRRVIGRSEMS